MRTIAPPENLGAAIARAELKKHWTPTETAFRRFLHWLDEGVDSGGERYLEIRRRLELYFERRNCIGADTLADETLNRVTRRLDEEGSIAGVCPPQYCYIVAKLVLHEYLRSKSVIVDVNADDSAVLGRAKVPPIPQAEPVERLLTQLERCLETLPIVDRELIIEYYRGDRRAKIEQRRSLAARFRLSANALTIRACRLREKLEHCVKSMYAP